MASLSESPYAGVLMLDVQRCVKAENSWNLKRDGKVLMRASVSPSKVRGSPTMRSISASVSKGSPERNTMIRLISSLNAEADSLITGKLELLGVESVEGGC